MKYLPKSLAGKLTLFFGVVSLSILVFIFYLGWNTNSIRHKSGQVETVYFPLSESLEALEISLDRQVNFLTKAALERDTLGLQQSSFEWATSVAAELKEIKENASALPGFKNLIDSLTQVSLQHQERFQLITNWITDNFVNAPQDSAFQAELPSREQAELVPLIDGVSSIQDQYKQLIGKLKDQIDARIRENSAQVASGTTQVMWVGIVSVLIVLGILISSGIWFTKRFKRSLTVSSDILNHLVKGEVTEYVEPSEDEFGAIVDSANKLTTNLKQYSSFAQSIGEGQVDFEFHPVSDNDMLGTSLVQMRQKLKVINEDDKKRNWVTEGLANFADIMRRSDDYEGLAHHIVSELVKYTKSNQGGIFILNNDNEKDPYLQLTACYAFERKKYLKKRIDAGEGLVGQCFLERRTIYLKEIPQAYVRITSGLGGTNPSSLLIVPLKINDAVEGVIELASFKEYQPHEIQFVEKVAEVIASTISNARINTRTRRLLEESQQHSEELRAQEEEMRQNMEEMQATQEQLHRQAEEMRKMHENLDLERSMFQVLMEYLPDRITYKDRESRILRVNKAKATRFKVTAEEMIGKTDYDYFSKEHADKAILEEQELLREGEPKLNIEERAVLAGGDVVWASTSRIPFKNNRGEMIGMFIITKDVTQLRLAEASILDREKIIQRLLNDMPVFRYTIGRNGFITEFWKSKLLNEMPDLDHKPAKDFLPEVNDLLQQEESGETDVICKGILEIKGEKEIFKHFLFKDSSREGAFLGFALKQ
jgi:PAS domain S-box-containing protein